MNDRVLRKVRTEIELLLFVSAISIALSVAVILDVAVGFVNFWQSELVISLLRLCELAFALSWLLLSIKFIFDIHKFRRRHFRMLWHGVVLIGVAPKLEEKHRASEVNVAEVVRDMVAFYRTYYREIKAFLALAAAASLSIIAVATYSVLYENLSFWIFLSRWLINAFLLLAATAFYTYLHRRWGEKLSMVSGAEERLSEMLGGPLEA